MVDTAGDEVKKGSRYALVMAVAKRAKQLKDGAPKLVECKSKNPITIAMEEIASGKLQIVVPTAEQMEAADLMAPSRAETAETADLLRIEDVEDIDTGDDLLGELLKIDESDELEASDDTDEEVEEDSTDALDYVVDTEDVLDESADDEIDSDLSETDDQEE